MPELGVFGRHVGERHGDLAPGDLLKGYIQARDFIQAREFVCTV
jgi:hypothetical protein